MTSEPARVFPGWNWQDPDSLAARMDEFSAAIARCDQLEQVAPRLPRTRAELAGHGVSGIEFAAFRTEHPSGLATDLAALTGPDGAAEFGPLYRVDGRSLFTRLDIGEPLPFADGALDWAYAEHLIEHVTLPVAIGWLAEVRRVLAPGGLLRITTPDLRIYIDGYRDEDRFFAKHRRRLEVMQVGPPMPERKAFMLNQIFYLYGHRWIYDLDELIFALTEAGFDPAKVRPRGFREGERADVAALDTTFRRDESMYVEVTA